MAKEHLNKNVLILVGDQSSSCCIFGFLKFESLFGSIMQNKPIPSLLQPFLLVLDASMDGPCSSVLIL